MAPTLGRPLAPLSVGLISAPLELGVGAKADSSGAVSSAGLARADLVHHRGGILCLCAARDALDERQMCIATQHAQVRSLLDWVGVAVAEGSYPAVSSG